MLIIMKVWTTAVTQSGDDKLCTTVVLDDRTI